MNKSKNIIQKMYKMKQIFNTKHQTKNFPYLKNLNPQRVKQKKIQMDKKNTNQGVKSCKVHCALLGLCKYWNRGNCNNSTCKYLHTCIASIQPLKITRHSEITLIISKQVTLSPPEAAIFINENYKNSEIGLTILLDNKQTAANLKKIVRGNTQDKTMRKEEVEKLLLQHKGKKQQGIKNKNKIQITKLEQNTTTESRSETKIENQSIFRSSQISAQQKNQDLIKKKHESEKIQLSQINLNQLDKLNKLNNQNTSQKEKAIQNQTVSKTKRILKNSNNILTNSSNSTNKSTNKRPISPIQQEGIPSLTSSFMDSKKSGSSSSQLYYDNSPKNENSKSPPKIKSTLYSDQQSHMARTNKWTSQMEKIEKQEEDHQQQILSQHKQRSCYRIITK